MTEIGFDYEEDYDDDWWDVSPDMTCIVCGDAAAFDNCARCGSPLCGMHRETRAGFCLTDWCQNDPEITRNFLMAMGDWNPSPAEKVRWAIHDWWHYRFLPWWRERVVSQVVLIDDESDIPF